MKYRRFTDAANDGAAAVATAVAEHAPSAERHILGEEMLCEAIVRERHRTDRSNRPFLLMLLDLSRTAIAVHPEILAAVSACIRETDIVGWYEENAVLALLVVELPAGGETFILATMIERVTEILRRTLTLRQASSIAITCHAYPENHNAREGKRTPALYPDLCHREQRHRFTRMLKRGIDIVGSCAALALLSPVLAVTALLVRLSSKGPIIYRQQRLGQYGKPFQLLKFRSMRVNCDAGIHAQFMKTVIAGTHNGESTDGSKPAYKMTNDPRITPIGRFIRRYSLDELPQFVNVLKGEMSLVGPRPPLQYEFEEYQLWHRRRVLEARPGLTGLWQVQGRSRVRFDDMVRLDLQYARTWSLWLDLQILLRTPAAVLLGDDAF
jgi:lipopolysaccharide/colanic/teichoic acid biosynthesis glycosyltransferase